MQCRHGGAGGPLPPAGSGARKGAACARAATVRAMLRGIRLMQDAKRSPFAHNGRSCARPRAEHSPMTHDGRALWSAVQSNEVYLTP